MLGWFQAHAVNVYEVLKCVGSVSFTSKLPQSNGPACLENELRFLVACNHNSSPCPPPWMIIMWLHIILYLTVFKIASYSVSLYWTLLYKKSGELWLHKRPRLRFTQMARSSLPLSFFELIFCQQRASRTVKVYVLWHLRALSISISDTSVSVFLASFIFRRLQFKKQFAWLRPILKHHFNPLVHLWSMSQ